MAARYLRAALSLTLAAISGGSAGQEQTFVERVDVNVRTVLVIITDKGGRRPGKAPTIGDLAIREDGKPVRILDIEAIRGPAPPFSDHNESTGSSTPRATANGGVSQYLYVDSPLLQRGSLQRLARALGKNADELVSIGPLGIVVADSQPRQRLAPTRDASRVHAALDQVARDESGREQLAIFRRQTLDQVRQDPTRSMKSGMVRSAALQELQIVRDSLEGLRAWAAALAPDPPMFLYLASDGFDTDASQVYREAAGNLDPTSDLFATLHELQLEFAPQGSRLIAETSDELVALGIIVVPLALGGNFPESAVDASSSGASLFQPSQRPAMGPENLFAGPMGPLRTLATDSGGDVATSESALAGFLARRADSYIVSFHSEQSPDGKTHTLEIVSLRDDLAVQGPRLLAEGTPASVAARRTIRALQAAPSREDLEIHLTLDGVHRNGSRSSGTLHVSADLEPIEEALEIVGNARLRVTIAVEVRGTLEPFLTQAEIDVPRSGEGSRWFYDAPISWPKKGRRVAVTVEEIRTGTRGTAAADLPQ